MLAITHSTVFTLGPGVQHTEDVLVTFLGKCLGNKGSGSKESSSHMQRMDKAANNIYGECRGFKLLLRISVSSDVFQDRLNIFMRIMLGVSVVTDILNNAKDE